MSCGVGVGSASVPLLELHSTETEDWDWQLFVDMTRLRVALTSPLLSVAWKSLAQHSDIQRRIDLLQSHFDCESYLQDLATDLEELRLEREAMDTAKQKFDFIRDRFTEESARDVDIEFHLRDDALWYREEEARRRLSRLLHAYQIIRSNIDEFDLSK
eukprot:TRINITY_DN13034_c0_g1_i2.p1 TRINITY_DN13034_c0_g1~~TRINITY_DN13034_c0_g1_i2.p1  ORF type:complete len:181 (-),score=14.74 TRINITY_DN13034_c0_g1_i2:28-501(-)